MMKRLLSLFLALAMVLSMVPSQAFAQETPEEPAPPAEEIQEPVLETEAPAEETEAPSEEPALPQEPSLAAEESTDIASGVWGDNLSWVIDAEGVFTLSGTGEMRYPDEDTGNQYAWFPYSSQITSAVIAEGVTTLESRMFVGCYALTGISLPASVETLSADAFDGASALARITVAEGNAHYAAAEDILYTKDMAELIRCPEGKTGSVALPQGVENIGYHAFINCTGVTAVTLPAGLKTIDTGAFSGSGIGDITLPASVTTVEMWAFTRCFNMTAISVEAGNAAFCAEDGVLYSLDKTALVAVPAGKTGELVLPDTVTALLPGHTMAHCTGLTSIRLSKSLTEIPLDVFLNCISLQEVHFPGNAPAFAEMAFYGLTFTAYYPANNPTWTEEVRQNYGGTITWVMEGSEPQPGAGDAVLNGITLDGYELNAGESLTATLDITGEGPYTVTYNVQNLAYPETQSLVVENQPTAILPFPVGGNYLVSAELVNGQGGTSYASDGHVIAVYDGSPYILRVDAETAVAGRSFVITPVLSGDESRVVSLTWQLYGFQEGGGAYSVGEAITNPDARALSFTIDEPGQHRLTIVTKTDTGASYFFDYWFDVQDPSQGGVLVNLFADSHSYHYGDAVTVHSVFEGGEPVNAVWTVFYTPDNETGEYETVLQTPWTGSDFTFTPDKGGTWRFELDTETQGWSTNVEVYQGLYIGSMSWSNWDPVAGEELVITPNLVGEGQLVSLRYRRIKEDTWEVLEEQTYTSLEPFAYVGQAGETFQLQIKLTNDLGLSFYHYASVTFGDGSFGVEDVFPVNYKYTWQLGDTAAVQARTKGQGSYSQGTWTVTWMAEQYNWENSEVVLEEAYTGENAFSFVPEKSGYYYIELMITSETGRESSMGTLVTVIEGAYLQGVNLSAHTVRVGESITITPRYMGDGQIVETTYEILDANWNHLAWVEGTVDGAVYTPQQQGYQFVAVTATNDLGYSTESTIRFQVVDGSLRVEGLNPSSFGPFVPGDVLELTPSFSGEGEVAEGVYTVELDGSLLETIPYVPGSLKYELAQVGHYTIGLEIINTNGIISRSQVTIVVDNMMILGLALDPDDGTPGEKTLTVVTEGGTVEWMEVSVYKAWVDFENGYYNSDYQNPLVTLEAEGNTASFALEGSGYYLVQTYVRSNNGVYHSYGTYFAIHGEGTCLDHVDVTPEAPQVGETVTITPVMEGDEAVVGTHYVVWLLEGQQASKLADSLELAESFEFVPQKAGSYYAEVYVKLESGMVWAKDAYFTAVLTEDVEPRSIDLGLDGEIVNGQTLTWDMAEWGSTWLDAQVLPYGADQEVVWSTSSKSIATVDDGTVTFLKPGTVKITATSAQDSSVKAAVEFNVVFKDAAKKFTGKLAPETNLYGSPSKSGIQVGDSVNVQVFGADKEIPLEGLTYEFTSDSYYDYADLDSETGEVTALVSGKTLKVKACFEGDPLKRSVTVSLKTIATIPGALSLVYDQQAEYCDGQDCGIADCSALLNPGMDNGVLVALSDIGGAYELDLTLTAQDQLGQPLEDFGAITWTSSNTKLATVKNGVLTVKKGAQGTVTITAKSRLNSSLTAQLVVELHNPAPKVADTSLTINTYLDGSYSLGIQGSAADPVVDVQLTDKNGVPMEDFEFAWEDGDWVIADPGTALDNGTTKGILNVFTAHCMGYGYAFSIKVANKAPTVTLKTTKKLNLKDPNAYAEITVTSKQGAVAYYELSEDMELLDGGMVGDVIRLELEHDLEAVPKPDVSGKLTLEIEGYRPEAAVVKSLKVSTEKVNNKAVLGAKTITLYTSLPGMTASTTLKSYWEGLEVEDVELTTTNAQGKKISVICENGVIAADFLDSDDLPKAGSYKFTAKPVIDGKEMAKITLTVKVAAAPKTTLSPATAKISAAENIPVQVAVTPALTENAPFEGFREITEGTYTYAEDIVLEYGEGVITLYLSEDFDLKTGKTYSIKLTPVYDGVQMAQITLKVNIRK